MVKRCAEFVLSVTCVRVAQVSKSGVQRLEFSPNIDTSSLRIKAVAIDRNASSGMILAVTAKADGETVSRSTGLYSGCNYQ